MMNPMIDNEKTNVRMLAVAEDRAGQRLDNFLIGQLKGAPKSLIYRICRTGEVRVNGGRAKPDRKLIAGDVIRVPPIRLGPVSQTVAPDASRLGWLTDAIIFENAEYLAINKPNGLAAHGGSGISLGAIEALRALRPTLSVELVHRLDRDTSGVLLFAKKRSALLAAQELIKENQVDKRYLALLKGNIKRDHFYVDAKLAKQEAPGGERMVRVAELGKPSLTEYRVVERFVDCTLVELSLHTGRTHQIRVHSQSIGHPVLGDPKYGDEAANPTFAHIGLKRMFLHAAKMRFEVSANEYLFEAELPSDLERVLASLRKRTQ
jgi:23S rRNA pseudouridine955/2504/2580 synthase